MTLEKNLLEGSCAYVPWRKKNSRHIYNLLNCNLDFDLPLMHNPYVRSTKYLPTLHHSVQLFSLSLWGSKLIVNNPVDSRRRTLNRSSKRS